MKDGMSMACSMHGRVINMYRNLVGKPKGKRPLERRKSRRQDNVKIDLKEIKCESVDSIHLTQDWGQ
jgi:hypothetical protein